MSLARLLLAVTAVLLVVSSPAAAGIPQPGDDTFTSAPVLMGGLSNLLEVTNTDATGETAEPNHEGFTHSSGCSSPFTDCNPSMWWSWTAPSSGVAIVETECDPEPGYDFTSVVYTGSAVNALTQVVHPGLICAWAFNATSGQTYKIVFSGSGQDGATPEGTLGNTSLVLYAKPGNDDFPGSTLAGSSGTFEGSNVRATGQPGEPDHSSTAPFDPRSLEEGCSAAADPHHGCIRSLWWNWTAPASGTARFDTCGSDYDTTLAVYTGDSVAGLTEIAANDDTDDPGPCGLLDGVYRGSSLAFEAVAGTTYRVAVAGYQAEADFLPLGSGDIVGSFSGPAALPAPLVIPPPSPPLPGPSDTSYAGALFSGLRTINVSGGRFSIKLRSAETADLAIDATTSQAFAAQRRRRRKVKIGTAKVALLANQTKTARIKIRRRALKLLRSRGRLRTRITVTGTDKAGNSRVTRRTVTLKLKRKTRRRGGRSVVAARG